jgi:hypothetical protein
MRATACSSSRSRYDILNKSHLSHPRKITSIIKNWQSRPHNALGHLAASFLLSTLSSLTVNLSTPFSLGRDRRSVHLRRQKSHPCKSTCCQRMHPVAFLVTSAITGIYCHSIALHNLAQPPYCGPENGSSSPEPGKICDPKTEAACCASCDSYLQCWPCNTPDTTCSGPYSEWINPPCPLGTLRISSDWYFYIPKLLKRTITYQGP